jgi:hypothetical protein
MGVTSMMEVMGVSVGVGVVSTRAMGESLLARDPMSRPLPLLSISIGSQYATHAQLASSRRDKVIVCHPSEPSRRCFITVDMLGSKADLPMNACTPEGTCRCRCDENETAGRFMGSPGRFL